MRERHGRVRDISEVADGVLCIKVEALDPGTLAFRPGQFVSIAIGQGRRSYSVASVPEAHDGFDLLIKPYGNGATAQFVRGLHAGDPIHFFGPMGYFFYDSERAGDVVFGATGVGISAIWSMVEAALAEESNRQLRLFWGIRDASERFWHDRLDEMAAKNSRFSFDVCISQRGDGHITPLVIETAGSLEHPTYYLCGHGSMIAQVGQGLQDAGIAADAIRTEAFYPP